ncbi:retrovirus-related pol polyprotein from transposon TNT 1-94 [Tanacetum coccineum]
MFKRRLIAADQASVFMEMMSDHNSSDLAPQRQEMSVENVSSGLVPSGTNKASDYDNSDPGPPRQYGCLYSLRMTDSFHIMEIGESSSRNIDNTDVHSFQPQSHDYRWTRDHPLEQVRGNPTMPVQTRRQLATDPEMCMFALTVSIVEPKNIKEAMADSAWIEAHMRMNASVRQTKSLGTSRQTIWLDEEVVRCQPEGFVDPDHPRKSTFLGNALYGFKQAPHELDSGFELTAFSDADHAGCLDTRKSTSGGIQFLGDKLVSWMSKKQNCTAMSSAEAEYVALSASYVYQLADMFTKAPSLRIGLSSCQKDWYGCLTPAVLELL